MSAVLETEGGWRPVESLPARSGTADQVEDWARSLPRVDLATLEDHAALLTRVDRKYVVPIATYERLLAELDDGWLALEVEGSRLFGYASTYFDTADLTTYRAHLQGRRRRYKVRVRRYTESEVCMLEVKYKGRRGLTVKQRQAHPVWLSAELDDPARAFVDDVLAEQVGVDVGPLHPVVHVANRRTTLVSLAQRSRLTVDTDLVCGWGQRATALRPGHVVLESKVEGHASDVDRALRRLGERPTVISKFCVGVACLGTGIPDNPWRRTMRRHFTAPST